MKYVQYINNLLKENVSKQSGAVLFGQNIDAASCLSGLTKGLSLENDGLTINTPNIENSLVGTGFGLMLNAVSSVFFMKQQDFLLLGIDQIVNTYNIIRQGQPSASFTIFPVTVDSGYDGPQSALNNFDDFCSIAGVDGFSFTNKADADRIISNYLFKPGFRILSTGQRLLQQVTLDLEIIDEDPDCNYFQYKAGDDVSIVCFNHALHYGLELFEVMLKQGINSSLFSVNSHLNAEFDQVINDLNNTARLILIDDTKSKNRLSDRFLLHVLNSCTLHKTIVVLPLSSNEKFYPCEDLLDIDYSEITSAILACISSSK
jgi:pyruvate/2-oxoglutarate/acetoin dehydrogenase E1 component